MKQARLRALDTQTRRLTRHLDRLQRTSSRYSWLRLAVFVAGLLAAGLALYFSGPWLAGLCFLVASLLFGLAVYAHRQVNRSIRRCQLWIQVKSAHIARATLDWEQIPTTFHHPADASHPFETDLDLVGQRSVHCLLDTAVTYEGSQRLRALLTAPIPDPRQIGRRQRLVRELVPLHLFRDRLAVNAMLAAGTKRVWRASHLLDWLGQTAGGGSLGRWLLLFSVLAGANALLLLANRLGLLPPWWQITFVVYLGLWFVRARTMESVWASATALQGALRQLGAVLRQLEAFSYRNTPHLGTLCAPFLDRAHRPSRYLSRMNAILAAISLRANPLLRLILNAVVPWDTYLAYRLNQIKADMAQHTPRWLEAWFELEALSSLANFAYLNPGHSFPDLVVEEEQHLPAVFQAEELGHPLIADEERVCNDLTISQLGQVTIITGSNMSGKSVFLKTVAVNLALAYAGGPVNARRLRTLVFRLFTCMGVSDSVIDGISYFYAEVKRLKTLLAELQREHPLPLFFCIDEIFRGTNNRERLIGSRAYVHALAGKHGTGLIATHDLELVRLAEQASQVVNYHFRDHIVDDRMAFDYTLRPGPCPTTNALKIMELEGLPIRTGYESRTEMGV